MKIINYKDFTANLKHWFDKVINDVPEVVIKRKGGNDLVLISRVEYNSLKGTTYLWSGKNRDVLIESIKELENGKGTEHQPIDI
jgi:antitoxin YefM